jgi:hypothetical protein
MILGQNLRHGETSGGGNLLGGTATELIEMEIDTPEFRTGNTDFLKLITAQPECGVNAWTEKAFEVGVYFFNEGAGVFFSKSGFVVLEQTTEQLLSFGLATNSLKALCGGFVENPRALEIRLGILHSIAMKLRQCDSFAGASLSEGLATRRDRCLEALGRPAQLVDLEGLELFLCEIKSQRGIGLLLKGCGKLGGTSLSVSKLLKECLEMPSVSCDFLCRLGECIFAIVQAGASGGLSITGGGASSLGSGFVISGQRKLLVGGSK